MTLVIHQRTQAVLETLTRTMPQSLLISGPAGVGLATIAKWLAGNDSLAIIQPQNVKEQVDSENGTISVELIRRLYDQTRSKQTKRAVVIIDNADRMNSSAQSAFLKLLEEPNQYIHFILTAHNPQLLKSTIRSRVQSYTVQPVSVAQTDQLLADLGVEDSTKQAQLRFIASGLPAEITRLVRDDEHFARRAAIISDARTLLQTDRYAKLLVAQKYHNQRDQAFQLIDSAIQIARRSLTSKPQQQLITQLEGLAAVRQQIEANGNIRLQLARFVL